MLQVEIDLRAANGTLIPYQGWVELTFRLVDQDPDCALIVPFLVTNSDLASPLIGYNVIEELVKMRTSTNSEEKPNDTFLKALSSSFVDANNQTAEALVNFIQTSNTSELCHIQSFLCHLADKENS